MVRAFKFINPECEMDIITHLPKADHKDNADTILEEYDKREESSETENIEQEDFLPTSLQDMRSKLFVIAALIASLSVGCSMLLHNYKVLYFLLFSLYFAFTGEMLRRDYKSGKIIESVLICTSVRKSAVGNMVIVNFRNADENSNEMFFQFQLPSRKAFDQFAPSAIYIVYYNTDNPTHIISSVPV